MVLQIAYFFTGALNYRFMDFTLAADLKDPAILGLKVIDRS
jgi:hypothetical protein